MVQLPRYGVVFAVAPVSDSGLSGTSGKETILERKKTKQNTLVDTGGTRRRPLLSPISFIFHAIFSKNLAK